MWRLEREFRFEAAHCLPNHDGKCKRLHGHSWEGKVVLERDSLDDAGPEKGMVTDFGNIRREVDWVIDQKLDHFNLNDTVMANPTSEEIARWLYEQLEPRLPHLAAVIIKETANSSCEYRP